jgi:putative ABC transport system substrate-binding protein
MRRRDFVTAVAGAVLTGPAVAHAQSVARPLVAYLGIASRTSDQPYVDGLRRGMVENGHILGDTVELDERYADGRVEGFDALLAEVVTRGVDVIVVPGIAAALAVREQAPQIPCVAIGLPSTVIYPDLFASLHRPGGSVTGFSPFGEDLADKRVELLREVVPAMATIAILHNSVDPLYRSWGEKTEDAARQQGLQTLRLGVTSRSEPELAALMQTAHEAGAQGMIIVRDFLTHVLQEDIADAANAMGMATMAEQRVFAEQGGLMSYGANQPELFRRAATYVDEILQGASPAEMPIQLATEFELVVNQQTAEALGITIPPSILLRADEVLE